jgi:tetratricopeptide (TPR) repeat protein
MPESNTGQGDVKSGASSFLARGRLRSQEGRFAEAIEMFLSAINLEPDLLEAHEAIWETGLMRKAEGGRGLGFFETMRLRRKTGSDKQRMLNFEKMLAYDPSDTDALAGALQMALKLDLATTAPWLTKILRKANADSPKLGLRR